MLQLEYILGGGVGTWSSSNLTVATVDGLTGAVTAVGAGTCDIIYTITGGCGESAKCPQDINCYS